MEPILSNPNSPRPPQPPQPIDGIRGTSSNDSISGSSIDDTLVGSTGNDSLYGDSGTDTVNYNILRSPISLEAGGVVNKGSAGTDLINGIEHIIAPDRQPNTIDASTGQGIAAINVDLSNNRLSVSNIPGIGVLNFVVDNFANVIGTPNIDTIVGNNANNYLEGGAGDDTLLGLSGNDFIVGVDVGSVSPGLGERDVLFGGEGRDIFALGDRDSTYYQGDGFASIRDFGSGVDRIQLHGNLSDYTISGNTIFLSGTSDRIAVIDGRFNSGDLTFV